MVSGFTRVTKSPGAAIRRMASRSPFFRYIGVGRRVPATHAFDPGASEVEFVRDSEVIDLLKDQGVARVVDANAERVYLRMDGPDDDVVRLHLATAESTVEPLEGARVIPMAAETLPDSIDRTYVRDTGVETSAGAAAVLLLRCCCCC